MHTCAAARLQGGAGGSLAGNVLQEVVLEASAAHRSGADPTSLLRPQRVRLSELPLPSALGCGNTRVAVPEAPCDYDFSMLAPLPYAAEFEYKLLGHAEEQYSGLVAYLPPCLDQPLMDAPAFGSDEVTAAAAVQPAAAAARTAQSGGKKQVRGGA